MKKTVTVWKLQRTKVDVEIEFPIYRRHELDIDGVDAVILWKIEEDGRCVKVSKNYDYGTRKTTFEIRAAQDHFIQLDTDPDYQLGLERFAGSAEEFDQALAEAVNFAWKIAGK